MPGVTAAEIRAQTGFELEGDAWPEMEAPSAAEISALEAVDPKGVRYVEFQG